MAYASVLAIRETAGLLSRVDNETPGGLINSSNREFVVKRKPIVDRDDDGEVTPKDVIAYVNDEVVTVSSVDADTGTITLASAPATGTRVRVYYSFSPLATDYVEGKAEEADSWVDMKVGHIIATPLSPVPAIIKTAAELYAAGLILMRDWGNRSDTELTAKDGGAKMDRAAKLIQDYLDGLKNKKRLAATSASDVVSTASDGDVFSREPEGHCREHDNTDDEFFMRRC